LQPADEIACKKLLQKYGEKRKEPLSALGSFTQMRSKIRKDIWTDEHFHMTSDSSQLTLSTKAKSWQAEETCSQIQGFLQQSDEDLFTFEAVQGAYRFPSNTWECEGVSFSKLSETGVLFSVKADQAQAPFLLKGHVQLHAPSWKGQETYALAEKASYNPKTRQFLFEGSPENPVLCFQDGKTFSAPELVLHKKDKHVEGKGVVRLSFTEEEKKRFESIFSNYL